MAKSLLPARWARCAAVSVIAIYVLTSVCANAQTNTFQVSGGEPWIDVTGQGAYLDAQTLCNASNSTTMSPYTISLPIGYSFSGAFVGEEMWVQGSPPLSLVPETPLAVGTVTGVGVGANSVTFMATSGSVPMASGLCVTWGHDDVYALQASLNLLMAAPFNGVGGEIKIPHGKTGQMMVGQQQAC